jgi:hypothetical protein
MIFFQGLLQGAHYLALVVFLDHIDKVDNDAAA